MDNIVDFYIDSVDNDKNGVSMEVMKCVDYFICDFYIESLIPDVWKKRPGLNIYISNTQPLNTDIVEGSIWILMQEVQQNIVILDKIDTTDKYDKTILVFTRDGIDPINLYSGFDFTSVLNIRGVQYSDGDIVQIVPYRIYQNGTWIQTDNGNRLGVKIRVENQKINTIHEDNDDNVEITFNDMNFNINILEGVNIGNNDIANINMTIESDGIHLNNITETFNHSLYSV